MNKTMAIISALLLGFWAKPTQAQQDMQGSTQGHRMSANDTQPTNAPAAKELMAPIPAVLDNYGKIQAALAADKLDGVPEASRAIAKLVTDDKMKMLPAETATQASTLAKAKDLEAARASFKQLSASLIGYLDKSKAQTGKYYEVYCPMADASWIQTDKSVKNPYYGKSMPKCGLVKRTF